MQAVIFERKEDILIPLTLSSPKLMLNVMDKPLIFHISDYLSDNGITDCRVFCEKEDSLYPSEVLEKIPVIKDKEEIYETIEKTEGTILAITKPVLTDIPLKKAFEYHFRQGGVTAVYNKGKETGIYIVEKEAFFKKLNVNKISINGYFTCFDTARDYIGCHRDILKGKISVKTDCAIKNKGVMVGENTMLKIGALIKPPVFIGTGTVIESGARIEAYSVIGSDCVISSGALIGGAVLNKGCFVGEEAVLKKSLIAPLAKIKERASLEEFSAVGEGTVIGEAAMVSEDVSIWNEKYVPDGEKITENIINGTTLPAVRFENNKVYGKAGMGFNPEEAALFGACFSRIYPSLKLAAASSSSPVASMIRYAVMSGIQSAGGKVADMGISNEGALRFGIDYLNCAGGLYIYGDKEIVISLFGKNYTEIRNKDFKRLCNIYPDLKFARAEASNITEITDSFSVNDIYNEKISSSLKRAENGFYVYFKSESKYTDVFLNATGIKLIPHRKRGYISGVYENGKLILYDEEERLLTDKEKDMLINNIAEGDEKLALMLKSDGLYAFFKICVYIKDKKTTLKEYLVFLENI